MKVSKPKKWEDLLSFLAILLTILLLNINANSWFFRIDLTEEKRYSLSEASKDFLEQLDDVVYIEIFLEGDGLDTKLKKLQKAIRETVEEFKLYGGGRLSFKFTNPNESPNLRLRSRIYQEIESRGLKGTDIKPVIDGKETPLKIFPGAIISYGNQETARLLLKGSSLVDDDEFINQAIEGIEYELMSAMRQLTLKDKKRIAFTQGHDELTKSDVADITASLAYTYLVDHIYLDEANLEEYATIIVAQPKKAFTDKEKFLLDQFIMKGGGAIFLLDPIQMNIDSIPLGGTYAFGYDLQLDDLLFRYGVRVENTLVQDMQAGILELYVGNYGNRPNIQRLRWPYYVNLYKFSEHPIVRNMDILTGKFVSTIDTVKANGVTKTPLVFTSNYTRVKQAPTKVDLNELRQELSVQANFNRQHVPVSYMLEGEFRSLYANQSAPPSLREREVIQSGKSKVLVFADADIIRNEYNRKTKQLIPIDEDKYTKQHLSNKDFLMNALAYMTEEGGIINARKKQISLRPLDPNALENDRAYWQNINFVLPISLILIFRFLYVYLRKRKYTQN